MRAKTRSLDIAARVDILAAIPEEIKQVKGVGIDQLFLETAFDKWFPDQEHSRLSVALRGYMLHISMVVKASVVEHKIEGNRDTPDHYEYTDLECEFEHSIPSEYILSIDKSIEELNP
jgi:hypothetical protein